MTMIVFNDFLKNKDLLQTLCTGVYKIKATLKLNFCIMVGLFHFMKTLKEENFAVFDKNREIKFPQNLNKSSTREIYENH